MKMLSWEKAACVCGSKYNCFCPDYRLSEIETETETETEKIEFLKKFSPSPDGEIKKGLHLDVAELERNGFSVYVSSNHRPFPEAVAFQRGLWREDGRYGGETSETVCNIFVKPPKMMGLVFTSSVLDDGEKFRKHLWAES